MRRWHWVLSALTPRVLAVAAVAITIADAGAGAQQRPTRQRRLEDELSAGHAVLIDIHFASGSQRLEPSARPRVVRLARAINATSGTYLIGAYVDDTGDAERDQALSEKRAVEVKALLVLEGVPPERVVAAGYGAARAGPKADGADGQRSGARIEVLRVQ